MPAANKIKSRFLGKRGDPFNQFERLVEATTQLRDPVKADPAFFFELANDLIADSNPDAARKLLAYRILSILNSLGNIEHIERYRNTIFDLKKSGYWIGVVA